MSFLYIASPYTHKNQVIVEERYTEAKLFTIGCLRGGLTVYSPIVFCHELAKNGSMPIDFDFWQQHNRAMLSKASGLIVLRLLGWEESKGVKAEIEFANQCGIGVEYE